MLRTRSGTPVRIWLSLTVAPRRKHPLAKTPKGKIAASKKTQMTLRASLTKTWKRNCSLRQKTRMLSRPSSICWRIFLIKINLRKISHKASRASRHRHSVWAWKKVLPKTPSLFQLTWLKNPWVSTKTKKCSGEKPPSIWNYRSANLEETALKLL